MMLLPELVAHLASSGDGEGGTRAGLEIKEWMTRGRNGTHTDTQSISKLCSQLATSITDADVGCACVVDKSSDFGVCGHAATPSNVFVSRRTPFPHPLGGCVHLKALSGGW